jgi:drug/metabolite transporter (DMT)-like permease
MTLVVFFAGLVTAPFMLAVEVPVAAALPYIIASMVIHLGYYVALVGAYRAGDLSHGYPIMRGIAPLIVSVSALAWLGEAPTPAVWAGVLLICGGVLSLGFVGFRWAESRVSLGWALANAVIIASYTLVDAAGVRAAGKAEVYVVWLFTLDALPFTLLIFFLRKEQLLSYTRQFWLRGLIGGALSAAAYGVVLWAMTRAPVRVDRRLAAEGRPHRAPHRRRGHRRGRRHRAEAMTWACFCPPVKGGSEQFLRAGGFAFQKIQTPRSPSAHDPLVRGSNP